MSSPATHLTFSSSVFKIFFCGNAPVENSVKAGNSRRILIFFVWAGMFPLSVSSRLSQVLLKLKSVLFLLLRSVQKPLWRSKLKAWPSLIPPGCSSLLWGHLANVAEKVWNKFFALFPALWREGFTFQSWELLISAEDLKGLTNRLIPGSYGWN